MVYRPFAHQVGTTWRLPAPWCSPSSASGVGLPRPFSKTVMPFGWLLYTYTWTSKVLKRMAHRYIYIYIHIYIYIYVILGVKAMIWGTFEVQVAGDCRNCIVVQWFQEQLRIAGDRQYLCFRMSAAHLNGVLCPPEGAVSRFFDSQHDDVANRGEFRIQLYIARGGGVGHGRVRALAVNVPSCISTHVGQKS